MRGCETESPATCSRGSCWSPRKGEQREVEGGMATDGYEHARDEDGDMEGRRHDGGGEERMQVLVLRRRRRL